MILAPGRKPPSLLASLAALALLPPLAVLLWRVALSDPRAVLQAESEKTRVWLGAQVQELRIDTFAEIHSVHEDLVRQVAGTRRDLFAEVGVFRSDANQWMSESLARIDRLQTSVNPALDGLARTEAAFQGLAERYTALPDQVASELQPAWSSLQPEITCQALDGSGYGGCWHARITAVLGESAKAGGVFVQQFPLFTQSVNGILSDGHAWTAKYVYPHPMTRKQKVEAGAKVILGLGMAGLRGGVF